MKKFRKLTSNSRKTTVYTSNRSRNYKWIMSPCKSSVKGCLYLDNRLWRNLRIKLYRFRRLIRNYLIRIVRLWRRIRDWIFRLRLGRFRCYFWRILGLRNRREIKIQLLKSICRLFKSRRSRCVGSSRKIRIRYLIIYYYIFLINLLIKVWDKINFLVC